jgi:ribonuclease HI
MDPQPVLTDFDTVIFTDGGARPNPGFAAAATVVYDMSSGTHRSITCTDTHNTNNTMEAVALLGGLRAATGRTIIIGDSELILRQATGRYSCDSHYKPLMDAIHALLPTVPSLTLAHMDGHGAVPNPADTLCTWALVTKHSDKDAIHNYPIPPYEKSTSL